MTATPDRKVADCASFEPPAPDNARAGSLTRDRLRGPNDTDLARSVSFRWPEPVSRSFEKIARHAAVDELAHVRELVCLLWPLDVQPPHIDEIDFHPS